MSLIKREDLLKQFESGALYFQPKIREIIEAQPTVEAVPVTRCKDCLFCTEGVCSLTGKNVIPNWFCMGGTK